MKIFIYFIISLLFLSCNKEKRITRGQYNYVGNIVIDKSDTLFEGPISVFDKTSNALISTYNYSKNRLEGESIDYFLNGAMKSRVNYVDGYLDGEAFLYDSSNSLLFKSYYRRGFDFGPKYYYNKGFCTKFLFTNFEGKVLYKSEYEKDSLVFQSGSLINYTSSMQSFNGELHYNLFFYLVVPPHLSLNFEIYRKHLGDYKLTFVKKLNPDNKIFILTEIPVLKNITYYLKIISQDQNGNKSEHMSIIDL